MQLRYPVCFDCFDQIIAKMEKKITVIGEITIKEVRIEPLYTFLEKSGFSDIINSPIGQGKALEPSHKV